MNLDQFLAQTAYVVGTNPPVDITALSDEDALQAARDYTKSRLWRIEGADRKIVAITALIAENVQENLANYIANAGNDPELIILAKKLKASLDPDLLLKSDIYRINLGDPEVKAGFDAGVANGLLSARVQTDLTSAATYNEKPLANTTLEQVKAWRYPAVLTDCEHGGQDFVVSISNRDAFKFSYVLNEPVKNIHLTMYSRTDATAQWSEYTSPFILRGSDTAGNKTDVIKRPTGLSADRHFKFEYTPSYVGQIASIAVSVGQ